MQTESAAAAEVAPGRRSREPVTWLLVVLGANSVLGAIIGLAAFPTAWLPVGVATLVQLGATLLGRLAPRRPVLWAVVVALVALGSAVLHPVLSELAYSGGLPWIGLAVAVAALNLYRRAADWTAVATGSAALVLGSAGLVAVGVRAGIPPATAVMATSVYLLLGILAACYLHLRDARDDRVRRPELAVQVADERGGSSTADLATARRALAVVALRGDELVASTGDVSVRRVVADLRDVARRGLTGEGAGGGVTRIEVHTATPEPAPGPPAGTSRPTPVPELADREREILRLVATGASNAAIGRSLYLSEATVKQYVSRLMRRFDRENRTQLALMASRWFDDPEQPST